MWAWRGEKLGLTRLVAHPSSVARSLGRLAPKGPEHISPGPRPGDPGRTHLLRALSGRNRGDHNRTGPPDGPPLQGLEQEFGGRSFASPGVARGSFVRAPSGQDPTRDVTSAVAGAQQKRWHHSSGFRPIKADFSPRQCGPAA